MRVVPLFDGGGDALNSPVLAQVGRLMNLRGMGILIALRVEITITISVSIIIGFRHGFDFSPWNQFPEFGFGLGSIVIGFRFEFDIDIEIFFLTALILPDGSLKVLAVVDFDINFHFQLSPDGRTLGFNNFKHKVTLRRIGPFSNNLSPCDGRFQLAEENGQTVFPNAFGGNQSFYFVRAPGRCCLSWNFDFDLVRFTDDGPETILQPPFNVDFCLNALDSADQNKVIVVSDQRPNGYPPAEELDLTETDQLRAMFEIVNPEDGSPIPDVELRDVRDFGYQVEFYLDSPPEVCDAQALRQGLALATEIGDNVIRARLFKANVVIIDTGVEAPSFWPSGVLGFEILSFLARGLTPAVRTGDLPVTVKALITVTPTLAYEDAQGLHEVPTSVVERLEPFETPQTSRNYVLAAKLGVPSTLRRNQTLKLKVGTVTMTPQKPLENIPDIHLFDGREAAEGIEKFFTGNLVVAGQEGTITIDTAHLPSANELVKVVNLEIHPNRVEAKTGPNITSFVAPGRAVTNQAVQLTIPLTLSGGSGVTTQLLGNQLHLTLSNDETFEEYLRVFYQATDILNGPGSDTTFKNFDSTLSAALKASGAVAATVVTAKGVDLWNHACQVVQTLKDDRPLYWARLRAIGALRAYGKRLPAPITGTSLDQLLKLFELASRGLDPLTGAISFVGAPANARKAVLTGFDPFFLPGQPDMSNSSGLVALGFNNNTLQPSPPDDMPVYIRTALFPVRYADFDQNIVENAIRPILDSVVMIMTCSRGLDFYDVDRFAARNRGPKKYTLNDPQTPGTNPTALYLLDNNRVVKTELTEPPNLTSDPAQPAISAAQHIESSLPSELVITAVGSTRLLPAPQGGPPFPTLIPFVRNQSYWVLNTPNTNDPGKKQPRPADAQDVNSFTQATPPISGSTSFQGSGGNYLSNEIFYRTALLRSLKRDKLASGHLHLPWAGTLSNDPINNAPGLLYAVGTAAKRFLKTLFRMKSVGDVTFPQTAVNATSASRELKTTNETNQPISVATVEVAPAQAFTRLTALPATVGPNAVLSLLFTFTPQAVGVQRSTVTARDANGEILFTAKLTGEGVSANTPVNAASASNGAVATAQNYTQDGVYPGLHFQPSYANDGVRYTTTNGDHYWRDEHGLSSWIQIDFNDLKTISEVDVFTMSDAYQTQADPSPTQTFANNGTTAFDVQYWTGSTWQTVPGGSITGNNLVWRKLTFAAVTTQKIRVVVNAAVDGVVRIVEVEAWGTDAS